MKIKRPMCLISFVFMISVYGLLWAAGGVSEYEYERDLTKVTVCGKVIDKVYKNGMYSIHIERNNLNSEKKANNINIRDKRTRPRKMIIYLDEQSSDDFKIGQNIEATGSYYNFSLPENDGQFNMRKYYRIRGYEASLKKGKVTKVGKGYSHYKEWLYGKKSKTKFLYDRYMNEEYAGTLSAMVLGDKTGLMEDTKDLYQAAGISHILSLSGLHIATVGVCIYSLFFYIGLGVLVSSFFAIAVMISYGIMTGLSISTIRALIMFILAIIAKNIGRTYDLLSGVCLSSILILFENPYYVFDSGFLMSFLSVTGIAMLYPILYRLTQFSSNKSDCFEYDSIEDKKGFRKKLNRILCMCEESRIYSNVRQSLCISYSASIATLPVVMNSFYKISLLGPAVNIVVVPAMSVLLGLGIISAIIGNMLIRVGFFRGMICVLLFIAEKILIMYSVICERTMRISNNTWVTGECRAWQVVVYIILMVALYLCDVKLLDYKERVKKICIIAIAIIVLSYRQLPEYSVNALSVGQGACNVLYGERQPTILIDGGSIDVKEVGEYRIKPFLLSKGIDEVEFIFITHPDKDHISGIKELLCDKAKEIKVKNIIASVYDEELFRLADETGCKIHIMRAGDEIKAGDVQIKCISPKREENERIIHNDGDNEDLNDKSLVLMVGFKDEFSALYPGDISSEVERKLISDSRNIRMTKNIDYLSVPHHGSKYSSCEEFLTNINPKISVISVGKYNSYGHPHKETLDRIKECNSGAKIYRTDECGQVTILVGNSIRVRQFN